MRKAGPLVILLAALALTATFLSWTNSHGSTRFYGEPHLTSNITHLPSSISLPPEPDYSDPSQWYVRERGATADIFYIISTETGAHLRNGDTCHYADTYDDEMRFAMEREMHAVDSFYSGGYNYYSPYYRQISMQSWASIGLALQRLPLAIADVKRSWQYYIGHLNHGRPFILAGFSQGAHIMLDIIREMPDSVFSRMVAAYSIGYKVTASDLNSTPHLRPAQGATDTGVTICFNSVKSADCEIPVVSEGNQLCINPVNWRTDTVSTSFVYYGRRQNDTLAVRCDPASHLLIVEGFEERYIMPIIGRSGNYHNMELKFYYPYIRQNMADRIAAYFQQQRAAERRFDEILHIIETYRKAKTRNNG